MKICNRCGIEKELSEFNKNKKYCRSCEKEYRKEYRIKNIEKLRVQESNSYYRNHEKKKEYREENREKKTEYNKNYYKKNIDTEKLRVKKYQVENKEILSEKAKKYNTENRDKRNKYKKEWTCRRKEKDPTFRLIIRLRNLLRKSFLRNGYAKKSKSYEIIGISYDEFKLYIESLFIDGMSWSNFGEWHIDHKIPISWGKTEEEIIKLNHYTNLQPLWAEDNLSKGNKYSG
jgi:hypothetical protein